jgi:glucose/arabinose dehydrogenase
MGDPNSQMPWTGMPSGHNSHGTGSLAFALDGTLYVSTGDGEILSISLSYIQL